MIKKDIVQTILETPKNYVLQKRDDLPTVLHGGKNSLFGGGLETSDQSPLAGALRELREETSLDISKEDLSFICETTYRGVVNTGEEIEHRFHVFHLDINDANFDVYEGEGVYLLPKETDPADHNLTPSTNLILSIYMQQLRLKKDV